jgi:hypothetical protein
MIDGNDVSLFQRAVGCAINDQLVGPDKYVSISTRHELVHFGPVRQVRELTRRGNARAITVSHLDSVSRNCRFDSAEQQVI